MTVLYVQEQGAVVRKEGEQVKVTRRDGVNPGVGVLRATPVHDLEQIVLYGNVQVTAQAAALLLDLNIDVVFLSRYGKYRGRLSKGGSKYAQLRHAQLGLAGDERRALPVATAIVRAKLANQRNLLRQLSEQVGKREVVGYLQGAANHIEQMRVAGGQATNLESLRGFEGRAGADYFGAIKRLVVAGWNFQGRAYNPPPDPLNALFSFVYALLLKDVTTTLEIVGLDPYLGCFHALEYDRPGLALDLMEEFRPLIADRVVLDLVVGQQLQPGDFAYTGREGRPVELGQGLIPVVIRAYERRLQDVMAHTLSHTQQRLRLCMELQVRRFAQVVLGGVGNYEGMEG